MSARSLVIAASLLLSSLAAPSAHATFLQQGLKLVGADAVGNAQQGISVSVSADGNTAVVGGPGDNAGAGAAWVYTRSGGVWSQQGTKLFGTGAAGAAQQGYSVSLSADGNTAVVGGPGDNAGAGSAWVYTRSGGAWNQQKLVGTGGQGISVSVSADGNTAVVGGPGDNGFQGAAWVYTRSGGVWSQQKLVLGTGAVGNAQQGTSVSVSADGNTAVVGGISDDGSRGAAWVYTRSGGVWSQQGTKLVGTGGVGAAKRGYSVSLSADGNTAVVGGISDNAGAGAAWVYARLGSVWSQQGPKLVGMSAAGNAGQGHSVSVSADGNTAVVGGNNDNGNVGATWVYTRSFGVWSQQGTKLFGMGAVGKAWQGTSVSLSADGHTAVVGGYSDSASVGAAWVFFAEYCQAVHVSRVAERNGLLLYDSSGPQTGSPLSRGLKVCSDGTASTRLVLHTGAADNTGDIGIRLSADPNQSDSATYGKVYPDVPATSGPTTLNFRFDNPSVPPPSGQTHATDHIEFYSKQSGQTILDVPVQVYRAPVLLVHGVWADPLTFEPLKSVMTGSGDWLPSLVSVADYRLRNAWHLSENATVVPGCINQLLGDANSKGWSCEKVDVVAHSMGGLLTRLYLDSPTYRSDINRFVTLNSPHAGTQIANWISPQTASRTVPLSVAAVMTTVLGKDCFKGAVEDFEVDGAAINNDLNGASNNSHTVRSHAVVTTTGPDVRSEGWARVLADMNFFYAPAYASQDLFLVFLYGEQSDLVVPLSSQYGGLSAPTATLIGGKSHTGSASYDLVETEVQRLLNLAPSDAAWSLAGFHPPRLSYPASSPLALSQNHGLSSYTVASGATLSITAPPRGSTFAPGQTITVSVATTGDVSKLLIGVGAPGLAPHDTVLAAPSGTFQFTLPLEAGGPVNLLALGGSASGVSAFDTLGITIVPSAPLDSMSVYPAPFALSVGDTVDVSLFGLYGDGVWRNLEGVQGITLTSGDAVIARVLPNRKVVGVSPGTTPLTASTQQIVNAVPVRVVAAGAWTVSVPPVELPRVSVRSLMLGAPYPNPRGVGDVSFDLVLPAEQFVHIRVYDVSGRVVRRLLSANLTAGTHRMIWDAQQDDGTRAASGLYFIDARAGTERSVRRVVLVR